MLPRHVENHRRWFALYHYEALPILIGNVVMAFAHVAKGPTLRNGWLVVVSIGSSPGSSPGSSCAARRTWAARFG
jgi:hypothetical protein